MEQEEEAGGEASGEDTLMEAQAGTIFVDVRGAVVFPGVYELQEGSRVYEALEAAGGLKPDAAAESVNQARELLDGEQLVVMTREEQRARQGAASEGTDPGADGRVNLNTADVDQLCTLPGIGREKAEAVIAYREEKGPFSAEEEIMKVPGVKQGIYTRIKDHISVR